MPTIADLRKTSLLAAAECLERCRAASSISANPANAAEARAWALAFGTLRLACPAAWWEGDDAPPDPAPPPAGA